MQLIFVNGRHLTIAWRELLEALRHPYTLGLFLSGPVLFELMVPTTAVSDLGTVQAVLFWAHVMIVFYGTYLGVTWVCARANLTIYTPLLIALIAALLTLTGAIFLHIVGGHQIHVLTALVFWLFLWALMQFFELIFVTFVLGAVLQGMRQADAPPNVPGASPDRVDCLFVTGRRERLSYPEALRLIHSPATYAVSLASILLFAVFHPSDAVRDLEIHQATLFWAQALAGFFVMLQTLSWLSFRQGQTMIVPLVTLVVAMAVTLISAHVLGWQTGTEVPLRDLLAFWMFHWSVMVLAEFLIVGLAMDRILAPLRPAPTGGPARAETAGRDDLASPPQRDQTGNPTPLVAPPAAPELRLQGVRIGADEVVQIVAEEHYLRIVTDGRSRLLRGRMADVDGQMPVSLGLRVHRSHWVAARAVAGLRRTDFGLALVLADRTEVPVARARQAEVRAWLAQQRPDVAQG